MADATGIDWEDAFANGPYIPDADAYPLRWAEQAAAFRDAQADLDRAHLDLPYGPRARERFDLFLPDRAKGLIVFVHGGYWLRFDKSSWSHLAAGPLAHGWAVALPSYILAPDARIGEITQQVAQAIGAASERVEGPVRLAGHSAGGHLVSRMACDPSPLTPVVAERVERVVSISGLHDLRPLQRHSMNAKFGLDAEEAESESPALAAPRNGMEVIGWVGANERPEFLRQSAVLAEAWGRKGGNVRLVVDPDLHHFNVIEGLALADSPITKALAG